MRLLTPLPNAVELDNQYEAYVRACEKLAEMREGDSKATKEEIDSQFRQTESLLQDWIDSTHRFKITLN
jgi:hypothetical protein